MGYHVQYEYEYPVKFFLKNGSTLENFLMPYENEREDSRKTLVRRGEDAFLLSVSSCVEGGESNISAMCVYGRNCSIHRHAMHF